MTDDFDSQVAPFRAELHAYCYRMLGSLHDADDALQEALLGAWKGFAQFEGRSSLRTWLYRITTHACLRLAAQRNRRALPREERPPAPGTELDPMENETHWIEPYPEPPGWSAELKESIELAFVAALQHLPPNQRAALILCEVLGFEAADAAQLLEVSVASITSALQRARHTVRQRVPPLSQQAARKTLGEEAERALVKAYVDAWNRSDVDGLVALLAKDSRFSMPPFPTWFEGARVAEFLRARVFQTEWRAQETRASGQLAVLLFQGPSFAVGALNVVTLRGGEILEMTGFLDPKVHSRFFPIDR